MCAGEIQVDDDIFTDDRASFLASGTWTAGHELGHALAQLSGNPCSYDVSEWYADLNAATIRGVDGAVIAGNSGGNALAYGRTTSGYVWGSPNIQNSANMIGEDYADMHLNFVKGGFSTDTAGAARNLWMNWSVRNKLALIVATGE